MIPPPDASLALQRYRRMKMQRKVIEDAREAAGTQDIETDSFA